MALVLSSQDIDFSVRDRFNFEEFGSVVEVVGGTFPQKGSEFSKGVRAPAPKWL